MRKILLTTTAIALFFTAQAQFVYDYLNAGDKYFAKGDYSSAAEYYEKYFGSNKTSGKQEFNPYTPQAGGAKKTSATATQKEQAIWKLAESYRLLNYPAKAEPHYKAAAEMGADKFPLASYYQGAMLRALEKYAEAEAAITSFLATYTTDDNYRKDAMRELENLKFIQQQLHKKDNKYFTLNKASNGLNTTGGSYAPIWVDASTLVFTSTRPADTSAKDKKYVNRLYQVATTEGGEWGNVDKVSIDQPKDIEQGVSATTADGNTMYITRWEANKKNKLAAIYISTKSDKGWSTPKKLSDRVNVEGYSSQEPFITADGKHLMFASNRPGGVGEYDIWFALLDEAGQPGEPMNAGENINTAFDDRAPYYHVPTQSLIFASKGRVGMGGFDFFQSKGYITSFAPAVNLGYPVNSVKDDIYFASKGGAKNMLENVILSSDRDASCCLELFHLQKVRPLKQISGQVVSCDGTKPLPGATLAIIDPATNKTLYSANVGNDGKYNFALEDFQQFKVEASAQGYITNNLTVQAPADLEEEAQTTPVLCLKPEPPKVNETFVVKNVYYEYDKAEVKPESYPALDEIVAMMNTYPELVIELGAHTDSKGSDKYNQKLSEARAKSVVEYLVSKGIDAARLKAKGYGEKQPIAENTNPDGSDNEAGREQNRRTEFKVLKN